MATFIRPIEFISMTFGTALVLGTAMLIG